MYEQYKYLVFHLHSMICLLNISALPLCEPVGLKPSPSATTINRECMHNCLYRPQHRYSTSTTFSYHPPACAVAFPTVNTGSGYQFSITFSLSCWVREETHSSTAVPLVNTRPTLCIGEKGHWNYYMYKRGIYKPEYLSLFISSDRSSSRLMCS